MTRRLLNLAPVCGLPPRDGADRRVWHLQEGLVASGVTSRLLARDRRVDPDGTELAWCDRGRWRNRKAFVALWAALTGQDYWQLKMLGPGVRKAARAARDEPWDAVLLNFLYALPLLAGWAERRMRLVVDTHNYDPVVFGGFRDASRNPLQRLLCARAIRTSRRALSVLPAGTVLVHVSISDQEAWRRDRPDLEHQVIENGCTVCPRESGPDYTSGGAKRLLFVGSLSAQMNQDALTHFARSFWPRLRGSVEFIVAGSRPTDSVRGQCHREGWTLRADVSDAELEALYADAHFAVLPFAYGAGSKLKLFEACGRGVPVLSTSAGTTGVASPPPLVLSDDRDGAWLDRIQDRRAPDPDAVGETLEFARRFSWPRLGERLRDIIQSAPEVSLPRVA